MYLDYMPGEASIHAGSLACCERQEEERQRQRERFLNLVKDLNPPQLEEQLLYLLMDYRLKQCQGTTDISYSYSQLL